MNRTREGKTSVRMVKAAEKQRQALELRKTGMTYSRICEETGYGSESAAYKAVMTALKKMLQEPAEECRKMEIARLDALLKGLWWAAEKGDYQSVIAALKVEERRAKLLGLDAPERVEETQSLEVRFIEVKNGNGNGNGRRKKKKHT